MGNYWDYAEIERYKFVSSSKRLICAGETNGRFNYAPIEEVYPPSKSHIPVLNPWGSYDFKPNPNYRPSK